MMLVGRHFDDATVLRAGHAYQQATGSPEAPGRFARTGSAPEPAAEQVARSA
jgi:Asp-tRNA(Asn)/Glu-tRNA(Gln) amidotransferase A subunit family amidase